LAKDPLSNVKDAFYVVSREESNKGLHPGGLVLISLNLLLLLIGHTMEMCYEIISTSGFLSSSFTHEQMMKLLSLINENPSPADSGANQHMTDSTKDMFNVVDISSLMLTVGHPNGTLTKFTAIGSLRLTSGIVLFDVLVILEYSVSLLSVPRAKVIWVAASKAFAITFTVLVITASLERLFVVPSYDDALSSQHVDEVEWKIESSLSEYDDGKYNVISERKALKK
ncbi:hypothetical protein Tco_0520597, partial [Tanacetum coccineum]